MSKALFVSVLLDEGVKKPLDYAVPAELSSQIQVGLRVEVPLRSQTQKGTIKEIKLTATFKEVKPILRILSSQKELSAPLWRLAEWISSYYMTPLQKVLRCFIPPNIRNEIKQKKSLFVSLGQTLDKTAEAAARLRAKAPKQAAILDALLKEPKGISLAKLLSSLQIGRSAVDLLIKKKLVKAETKSPAEDLLIEEPFFLSRPKSLNKEQESCLAAIKASLEKKEFETHLIFGVTGSGKTEVYLQAIQSALAKGQGAILLVPEVSLTSQTIERLRSRFVEKIAVLHHKRSGGEKSASWEKLQLGEIKIAIGARSAIFAPVQNLGLIIVDEEHDGSYKQSDEMPCYHGRDVAVMRGLLEKATVVLGSATPSLESRHNAAIGKYRLHTLTSRATKAYLPTVRIIDMKTAFDRSGGFTHFAPELLSAIEARIKTGEQTLLFLNARGYHRMQICMNCRTTVKCPRCDLALTFHKKNHHLKCHLCEYTKEVERTCSSCQSAESIEFKGFGTEHVERSLKAIFPEVRTLRMDRDTTRNKEGHEELFRQFRSHKADVLIGTQMIAKGFHFPSVTLVGVLNIDRALSIPDFRSSEVVFQLLTQVAGRAGRSDLPGEVIFQTFLPDHPVIQLAKSQDYPAFYEKEILERKAFFYPPFVHLVKVVFSGPDITKTEEEADKVRSFLVEKLNGAAEVLPVAPCGHPKIKDLYRFQFLIKTAKISLVSQSLSSIGAPKNVQVKIDPDTIGTFF